MKYVKTKVDEENRVFYYADFGSETHGRKSFRLWISPKLLKTDEKGKYIDFPCYAYIHVTPKGTKVLRLSSDKITYEIYVMCGFRGRSSFKILNEDYEEHLFWRYSSPRGNTGISVGALVVINANENLRYHWSKTGRTYGGQKSGYVTIKPNGSRIESETNEFDEIAELIN